MEKKKQWKQIIPRHIRIKKLPAKTQNSYMVSVGSDGLQQWREAKGDPGRGPSCLLPGSSMQRWMSAREGAKPLPWSPEWLWGAGEAGERSQGCTGQWRLRGVRQQSREHKQPGWR